MFDAADAAGDEHREPAEGRERREFEQVRGRVAHELEPLEPRQVRHDEAWERARGDLQVAELGRRDVELLELAAPVNVQEPDVGEADVEHAHPQDLRELELDERPERVEALGPDGLVTFMCDSVASALASTGADIFQTRLVCLRAVPGIDTTSFLKLMTNGVASRILNDGFFSSLIACYGRRASAQDRQMMLKFLPQCCSAIGKLGEEEFWRRVDVACTAMPSQTRVAALSFMRR